MPELLHKLIAMAHRHRQSRRSLMVWGARLIGVEKTRDIGIQGRNGNQEGRIGIRLWDKRSARVLDRSFVHWAKTDKKLEDIVVVGLDILVMDIVMLDMKSDIAVEVDTAHSHTNSAV